MVPKDEPGQPLSKSGQSEPETEKSKPNAPIYKKVSIDNMEYLIGRAICKIVLYEKWAGRQRLLYYLTSALTLVFSATLPVLIQMQVPIYPIVISLLVTILVSLEKLFHFREHWRNYETIAAMLRSELFQFQTGTGEYVKNKEQNENPESKFNRFVNRVEEAIRNERNETILMSTKEVTATNQQ